MDKPSFTIRPDKPVSLKGGETMPMIPTELQEGKVRYIKTTYVGDVSEDITIEGSAGDVLKLLKVEPERNTTPDITLNITPGVKVEEVVNAINTEMEKLMK